MTDDQTGVEVNEPDVVMNPDTGAYELVGGSDDIRGAIAQAHAEAQRHYDTAAREGAESGRRRGGPDHHAGHREAKALGDFHAERARALAAATALDVVYRQREQLRDEVVRLRQAAVDIAAERHVIAEQLAEANAAHADEVQGLRAEVEALTTTNHELTERVAVLDGLLKRDRSVTRRVVVRDTDGLIAEILDAAPAS